MFGKAYVFSLLAGISWFFNLSVLLTYWLASGRPRLPTQIDRRIAWVSDIGAQELKPFFVLFCCLTAIFFVVTTFNVHSLRYSGSSLGSNDRLWRRFFSLLSVGLSIIAGLCLAGLSIYDCYSAGGIHAFFLNSALASIGACAACVAFVWVRQTSGIGHPTPKLTYW